jgi:hypothetical protein
VNDFSLLTETLSPGKSARLDSQGYVFKSWISNLYEQTRKWLAVTLGVGTPARPPGIVGGFGTVSRGFWTLDAGGVRCGKVGAAVS